MRKGDPSNVIPKAVAAPGWCLRGFNVIKLLNIFGQTGLSNIVDPDQMLQYAASDQGLHCLLLTQQFYTHSEVIKWICWREEKGKQ